MKVTDEKIKEYCGRMDYKLLRIRKISFEYVKPNGDRCALLKAAAHSLDHRPLNKVVEAGQACIFWGADDCIGDGSIEHCWQCRKRTPAT